MRGRSLKKHSKKTFWLRTLLAIVFICLFFFVFKIKGAFYGLSKVSVVNVRGKEVRVDIYDLQKKTVSQIIIPGNTSLEASRDLGVWKIESLMGLGKNEKAGGAILKETINHSLKIPVLYWREEGGLSNLNIFEYLNLWFFRKTISPIKVFDYNLISFGYLIKKEYSEGGTYYETFSEVPVNLLPVISALSFPLKVQLNDFGENQTKLKSLVTLVENTGAKVVFIKKEPSQEIGCKIDVGNSYVGKYFRILLGKCKVRVSDDLKSDEATISIGSDFVKEF